MKKILTFLFTILLATSVMGSLAFPHPIFGHLVSDGQAVANAELKIENLNTKIITSVKTDTQGFFQVDLGNVDVGYRDDDIIKVSLTYCENLPGCSKQVTISGGGNEVSWDLAKEQILVPLPEGVIVVNYICADGSGVTDKSSCPALPTPPEPVPSPTPEVKEVVKEVIVPGKDIVLKECADGSIVEESNGEFCPEENGSLIGWIIGILVVVFGGAFAGGWKIYNGKFKHYHRGLSSYHDPNTKHSNVKYQHRTWKESILGCIKDVNKIQKGIDLSKEDK